MLLSALTLSAVLTAGVTSRVPGLERRHWGPAGNVFSEYSTYSESQVIVDKDGQPLSSTKTQAGSHYSHIRVTVTAFDKTFVLLLIKNRYLFASSYVEKIMTHSGPHYRQRNNMKADHCFYTGSVEGYSDSTVSACTCYGFLGEFTVGDETYSVEPVDDILSGRHRVYRESDSTREAGLCGNTDGVTTNVEFADTAIRKKRSLKWPQDLDGEIRVVELYVVNDFAQYVRMGNDTSTTIIRAKTIINAVSARFHPEGIYIALVGIEVWTSGDLVNVNFADNDATLEEFCEYRKNNINPQHNNDNTQFITGANFYHLGTAYRYTMCSYMYSCGWTRDYWKMPEKTAAVMAHEMGHNFDFRHDFELPGPCTCDDPSGKCIMDYSSANKPRTKWSQCSKDQLQKSFDENLDYCLHNIPQTIYDDSPDCGNGIVDQGEQCDCGNAPDSQCNQGCCVNCQLTTNATCAYGRCCDVSTCQLKSATTECRSAKSDCDLPEYCDGQDHLCPSDVHRRNTDSCTVNGVSAYCYNGECRTHQSQCRLLYGDDSDNADSECYSRLNKKGQRGAGCGYNVTSDTYLPCDSSDILCGRLYCQNLSDELVNFKAYFQRYKYDPWTLGDGTKCRFAVLVLFYSGPDRPDPGLVPDGASCGSEKMCLNQHCVDLSSVGAADCGNCSNHGVCNSLGLCHCEDDYSPPDCSQPGCGGSYHSNPAKICPSTMVTTTSATTTTKPATTTGFYFYVLFGLLPIIYVN